MWNTIQKDFLRLFVLTAVVALLSMLVPLKGGVQLGLIISFFNLAFPVWALIRDHEDWWQLWLFLLPLSLLLMIPTQYLATQLGVLSFPFNSLTRVNEVPPYMLGIWMIPLSLIIFVGTELEREYSLKHAWGVIGLGALFLFGMLEENIRLLGGWSFQNVHQYLGNIPYFVLISDLLLTLAAFYVFDHVRYMNFFFKLIGAFFVMLVYMGSLVFLFYFIEYP